jgi:regulator of protease activity HflC (stomatin/prohibitin superfamily)
MKAPQAISKLVAQGVSALAARLFKFVLWGVPLLALWSFLGIAAWDGAGTPFYRVKEKYSRVVTQFNGTKVVKDDPGIYFRFGSLDFRTWITSTQECSLRSRYIDIDDDPNPHEMQAADKIKFMGAVVCRYRVVDPYKYVITKGEGDVKYVEKMLAKEVNAMTKTIIRAHNLEDNVSKTEMITKKIFDCQEKKDLENDYGIVIEAIKVTHAKYPQEMNEKAAEAKLLKIMGEATKFAADDFKTATEIKAGANQFHLGKLLEGSGVTTEEGRIKALETLGNLNLYDMLANRQQQGSIIVLPHGSNSPNLTLPQQPRIR